MELTGSVLSGLFVALVWAVIRTVEFFIKKYGRSKEDTEIKELTEKVDKAFVAATKEQKELFEILLEQSKKMYDMHNVYNENHTAAWYYPSEALTLTRESKNSLENLESAIEEVRDGQAIIVNRISDLITSQKLMTERVGDLIAALNNKFSR